MARAAIGRAPRCPIQPGTAGSQLPFMNEKRDECPPEREVILSDRERIGADRPLWSEVHPLVVRIALGLIVGTGSEAGNRGKRFR
jgi:hypothetical protein